MHLRRRKVTPGTSRPARINFLVNREPDSGSDYAGSQVIDQFLKSQYLLQRWPRLFKVPNETDANPDLVDFLAMNVAALDLLEPARANLNFSIAGIDSVADHKVIRQAVLHPALSMRAAIDGGIALSNCAVMRYNPLPPARANTKPGRHSPHTRSESINRRWLGGFGQRVQRKANGQSPG
jgi:hypothetical protein